VQPHPRGEQGAAEVGLALQRVTDRLDELGGQTGDEDSEQQQPGDQRLEPLL
jgi:hypothetical protein